MNYKKKVGRPVKSEKDYAVRISTTTTPGLKKKIDDSGFSMSYILQYGARILLGDDRERELMDIERELAVLKPKVAMLESRKDLIIADKRRMEEYVKQKENEVKYLHAAFSQIVKLQEKIGKISVKQDWIQKVYGIQFNIDQVNRDFNQTLVELCLPPSYLVEKYRIRKVQTGEREEKMMVEIIRKESDNIGGEV